MFLTRASRSVYDYDAVLMNHIMHRHYGIIMLCDTIGAVSGCIGDGAHRLVLILKGLGVGVNGRSQSYTP